MNGRISPAPALALRSILHVKRHSNYDESDKFLTLDNLNSIQTSNFSWAELNSRLDRSKLWNVICKFRRANDLRNVSNRWWQPAARTAKSNERMWWNFTSNALIGVSCCLHVLQIIYVRQNVNKYSRISPILTLKQTVTCQRIRLPLNKLSSQEISFWCD